MKLRARAALALCTLLAAASALANAPLPKAWATWHYSRPIDLPQTDSPRLVTIVVPDELFQHSLTQLPDFRIIDDAGHETAYAIRVREGSVNDAPAETRLIENSFALGQYTQLVLDLGKAPPFHNAVEIESTETDFIAWVSVEASDDARLWRIVQPRTPFYRFRFQYHQGAQVIPYSENNARYLRIHILDGTKHFPVTAAIVYHKTETPPERAPFLAKFAPAAASSPARSAWIADFGGEGAPISEASFEVASPAEFIRSVAMFASDDGKQWREFTEGEIYRYTAGGRSCELLNVLIPFGGAQGRYWKVEVENGNDAPLDGVTLHLYTRPRHIYFAQQPGRSYRLIYGREHTVPAHYDVDRWLQPAQETAAVAGNVGAEQANSNYADPRPWTEKNRYILWLAIIVAALLLGYSAIGSLRHTSSAPNSNS